MYILKFIKIIKHILNELNSLVLMGVLSALSMYLACAKYFSKPEEAIGPPGTKVTDG